MFIVLDVGNTHTGVGCFNGLTLLHSWRVSTHPLCTGDEFKLKLETLLKNSAGLHLQEMEAIVAASVVPPFTRMLHGAFKDVKFYCIDLTWPFSFRFDVDQPEQVGTDRLVNIEAAVREYSLPCIIVDSGTATTICAISKGKNGKPEYHGGAILAGIELSMNALAKNAAQLFSIELVPPPKAIGKNTKDALRSGILFGYASMIDGMVKRFKQELLEHHSFESNTSFSVIGTGGICHLMKGLAKELNHFDFDLTLKGIAYLYESIRKR